MTDSLREQLQASLGTSCTLERELGGGGMSRVFVATEGALGRQIVVKVLPSETGSSVSAERFKREIQVAARLQHPHIVPLLNAGESHGLPYYTMPFVKGESLRARLAKGGELSINQTVHVLRDVAAALAYAHGEGVVHRDIKPENVMLSGGVAVVTDFGVAKAVDMALSDGGSTRSALTSLGVALGTPAYMAPEQATADPHVDHRADIYSFGCVAYEMLAGSSPFAGRPPQQLLAAHVTEAVEPVVKRRHNVPPLLAALVMKCLEKRAGDRPQSADELLAALDAIATPSSGGITPTMARMSAVRGTRTRTYLLTGAVVVLAVSIALWWSGRTPPTLTAGATTMVAATPDLEIEPAISPDGKLVAYVAETNAGFRVFVRQLAGGRANLLSGDVPGDHSWPRWSPDGAQIAFGADATIYVMPALGGTPRRFVEDAVTPAWSPTGTEIAYGGRTAVWIQPLSGGAPRQVAQGVAPHSPAWSPDGTYIAYAEGNRPTFANLSTNQIWVVNADGGSPVRVSDSTHVNVSPAWTPDGRSLLYVSNLGGALDVYQQPMRSSGWPAGTPSRVTTGLGPHVISLSADGLRLAHDMVRANANIWVAPMSPNGAASFAAATPVTRENQRVEVLELSHDGEWLAYDSDRAGNFDLYKVRVSGGEPIQLTTDPGNDFNPSWSPDDRQLVFHSQRSGIRHIYSISADGRGEKLIARGPGQDYMPHWSPDGRRVAFRSVTPGASNIYVIELGASGAWGEPRLINDEMSLNTAPPKWSPDGKLLVYARDGNLVAWPSGGGPTRVIADPARLGGDAMAWSWGKDPGTVYVATTGRRAGAFVASPTAESMRTRIVAVPVAGGPVRVVLAEDATHQFGRQDFTTDGKRLFFTLASRESDVGVMELKR